MNLSILFVTNKTFDGALIKTWLFCQSVSNNAFSIRHFDIFYEGANSEQKSKQNLHITLHLIFSPSASNIKRNEADLDTYK